MSADGVRVGLRRCQAGVGAVSGRGQAGVRRCRAGDGVMSADGVRVVLRRRQGGIEAVSGRQQGSGGTACLHRRSIEQPSAQPQVAGSEPGRARHRDRERYDSREQTLWKQVAQ